MGYNSLWGAKGKKGRCRKKEVALFDSE